MVPQASGKGWIFAALLFMVSFSGCGRLQTALPVESQAAREAVSGFEARIPARSRTLHSLLFEWRGARVSLLGLTALDGEAEAFSVVGLTPLGVKVFEVAGQGDRIDRRFVAPSLSGKGDLPSAVADSVRRIYFDRVPGSGAMPARGPGGGIRFVKDEGEYRVEWFFSGDPAVLVRERGTAGGRRLWTVTYGG